MIGVDVSFYDGNVDFQKMKQAGAGFVIIRAGQNVWVDEKFQQNWTRSKGVLPRGSYWYYDSRVSPVTQAQLWLSTLKGEHGELGLFADFEDTYGGSYSGVHNWARFLDILRERADKIAIYTAPYYWRDTPGSDDVYFRKYPLWIAHYTSNREPYIPLPWLEYAYWQFTDKGDGHKYGLESMTADLNYFNGDDMSTGTAIEGYFGGKVTVEHGYSDTPRPFYYHVTRFKRSDVERVHVNGAGFLGSSMYFYNTRGKPDIVINGDEGWYTQNPPVVKGLGVSDGNVYRSESDETCVQWDKNHQIIGMSAGLLFGCYNATAGSNILLVDGVIPLRLDDKPSVDPRTALFWSDTEYIIVHIDGRNNGTLGLTLKETAQFARSLGAISGHNLDGGDSCQLLVDGVIKNNLPDGTMHSVVQMIGFWINKTINQGEENMFKVVKTVRKRPQPSFFSVSNVNADAGFEFTSAEVVMSEEKISGVTYSVNWIRLPDGYWVPFNNYADVDEVYVIETDSNPVPEPTPTDPIFPERVALTIDGVEKAYVPAN